MDTSDFSYRFLQRSPYVDFHHQGIILVQGTSKALPGFYCCRQCFRFLGSNPFATSPLTKSQAVAWAVTRNSTSAPLALIRAAAAFMVDPVVMTSSKIRIRLPERS